MGGKSLRICYFTNQSADTYIELYDMSESNSPVYAKDIVAY